MSQEEVKPAEEKENKAEEAESQKAEDNAAPAEAEQKEPTPQEKLDELNNKYLRLYSEFENYRKRTTKERIELYRTAGSELLQALLPVMDDFECAMKSAQSQDVKGLNEGMMLIYQKFEKYLQQNGVKAIESPVGKDFDLNFHEAITRLDTPDEKMKGKVIDELEKGYMLHDKVIRYTKVVIGQ